MLYALTFYAQHNASNALMVLNNCSACNKSTYYAYYKQLFSMNASNETMLNLSISNRIIEKIQASSLHFSSNPKTIGDISVRGNRMSIKSQEYERIGLMRTSDNPEAVSLFEKNPLVKYYSSYFGRKIVMIDEEKIELYIIR